jgi:flagellar basal-body rod modification protein FlgD
MASVSSITSASSAATAAETTAARTPQKALGQNDFLKLLAKQYESQDPLKPKDDTAFIADMAQFSALEQSKATGDLLASLRADQQRATANSYLGHRVTVDAGKDGTVSGDVTAIDVSGAEPRLVVGDKVFSLSAVLRVEPRVVSAPAPVPVPAGGAQS